jgi:hypothetical protein
MVTPVMVIALPFRRHTATATQRSVFAVPIASPANETVAPPGESFVALAVYAAVAERLEPLTNSMKSAEADIS